MTQTDMIVRHLLTKGYITPMIAWNEYGCYRLSSVIMRLRTRGYHIRTIMRTVDGRSHAEYLLLGEPQYGELECCC